jgi:hypothetical protein
MNCVRLVVVADETPYLRVTEETIFTPAFKTIGLTTDVEIGDAEFDKRFLIKASTPTQASLILRGDVRGDVIRTFSLGARDLTFDKGEIVVTARAEAIRPDAYRQILDVLGHIARTLDRKKILVRVLGGERQALLDETGRTRCPYCFSNLTGDEHDLVACEKCHTVLHDGCWRELGRCPLLGCVSRSPERATAR